MVEARFFNANTMEWSEHPQFPDIQFKALETRATHPSARFSLVQVNVGGTIEKHVHDDEIETAYVVEGRGVLRIGDEEVAVETGMGVSVPQGIPHGLRNTGDIPLELFAVHTLVIT